MGSWMAGQHIHIQRQKARREREDVACLLQEQWTRSITKAILAEDPTGQDEAVREVRDLYRRCRIIMNDDAALLLSHILQVTKGLSDASGGTSDDKAMAKDWLRRLIVPRIPMEPSAPVTTTVLELFRAYSRGGPERLAQFQTASAWRGSGRIAGEQRSCGGRRGHTWCAGWRMRRRSSSYESPHPWLRLHLAWGATSAPP